jgi:fatty-acyl-CoA synthase
VRLVSCGRPFPEHDLEIVDEDGRRLPDRHVGRIVARGPSVMAGYFEDPWRRPTRCATDGCRRVISDTSPTASLFVCGRTKDLIIRHGRKYHPPDLESAIADLRGIRPAGVVVFGINRPDERTRSWRSSRRAPA